MTIVFKIGDTIIGDNTDIQKLKEKYNEMIAQNMLRKIMELPVSMREPVFDGVLELLNNTGCDGFAHDTTSNP